MSEFTNRIAAQRRILATVNRIQWEEELFGLSKGAIARWIKYNGLKEDFELVHLIEEASEKLFFLANKSQEQVTEEYQILSAGIEVLARNVEDSVKRYVEHGARSEWRSNV